MTTLVFDTGPLALFYAEDQRLRAVFDGVNRGRDRGVISTVTLSEFHYRTCRSLGREVAIVWSIQLAERLELVSPGRELAMAAGLEKCRNNELSLADAHALALARAEKGTLLTTDHALAATKDQNVKLFEV